MVKYLRYIYYLFYRPKIFLPKKSYSLLGEDIFLNKYFNNQKKGFYIDVGCYHPISGSNTYLLYKKGWRGMNFDISKLSIDLFNFLREKIEIFGVVYQIKMDQKNILPKKLNMLNTLNEKIAKIHFRNGFNVGTVKVNTSTIF